MIKSCYIHIPFCLKICSYCDFCKVLYQKDQVQKYLQELKKEVEENYKNEELDTIYIGGGTPSCLDLEDLETLLEITDSLKKSKNLEFTIEGNFQSITKEKLQLLKKHQVNRLSLGVESTHKKHLEFLGRDEKKDEIVEKIKWMRELDFSNINLDLIYALPNETIKDLEEDLEFLISLNVEHISTYSLIIEDHTLLKIRNTKPIKEELDEEMYNLIKETLKKNGYIHYEISNFAKPNKESRHNKCYWLNEEYYGFGLGASSYRNNKRVTNTRSITNYQKGIVLEEETLTKEDKMEYEVILNLRLLEGIDLSRWLEKYNIELKEVYDYEDLIKENLLELVDNHLRIKEDKLYLSNAILVKLLEKKKEL